MAWRLALVFVGFTVLGMPLVANAAISINEIAWMGTDEGGASCEWIELHNSSSDIVSMAGWTLTIENSGGSTSKVLDLGEPASVKYSGINGNGYYLIARDSGACKSLVPSSAADWVGSFGNGISNTGAKITLTQGVNAIDTVNALGGWSTSGIGGKNVSGQAKETPQWTGTGWLTAPPTPRGPNASAPLEELPEEEEPTSTPPVVTIGGTAPLVPVIHPVPELYIKAGPNRLVSAGADTPYSAIVYDSTGKIRNDARITWSFGDGGFEKGEVVRYAYREPGVYFIVVRAHAKGISAVSTIEVTAVSPDVAIDSVSSKGIVLRNNGDHLLDLSSWKIRAGKERFEVPADTVIPAGRSALFPLSKLGMDAVVEPVLFFPDGKVAAAYHAKPESSETGIEEIQEVEPGYTVAYIPATSYEEEPFAPTVPTQLAAVGAAHSSVVLKGAEEQGLSALWRSFIGAITSLVVP